MKIKRLLIANRGEIAVRIVRAAKELGITSVVAHSTADLSSLAVQMADEAVCIGEPQALKSYLNQQAVLDAAIASKVDAIHPGYGFLSESESFADAVVQAGLIFVGPSAQTISLMGNKAQARETAMQAGVPVVPGSDGVLTSIQIAQETAEKMGYPVLLKAAAGGGGRGIRIIETAADLEPQFVAAQREAQAAFGDNTLYMEKFIRRARHIEVQILGDGNKVVHLFERECSLQRRRQKIMEEAPSPALNDAMRKALCDAAVKLAVRVNYCGAGTVEFLYDEDLDTFYFIEMNTRIQVEHPVTEMITGIDLVRAMIEIAGGKPLALEQKDIVIRGHSIECRINAEDPFKKFMPNVGTITHLRWASGPGVRIDSMLYEGYTVPPFYDSMLAKVIVHDENRELALKRMARLLAETEIEGLKTTIPLHQILLDLEAVKSAKFDIHFLEKWMEEGNLVEVTKPS